MKTKIIVAALALVLPFGVAMAAQQQSEDGGSTASLRAYQGPGHLEPKDIQVNLLPTLIYMRQVINPTANAYWAQAGSLDDEGSDKVIGAPEQDYEWDDQISRAAILMEAGNGLHAAGREHNGACVDNATASCEAVWDYYVQELIDGGADALHASQAHDAKAAFDAGSKMYDACYGCHARYIPRPTRSLYTEPFPSDEEILKKGGGHGE